MKDQDYKYIRDGRAPIPDKELTSKIMSSIRAKDTKPELILRKALWNRGIRGYRLHWKKAPGKPDIAFPGKKVAIFVNGCYWHRCPHCKPSLPKTHSDFWNNKFEKNIARDKKILLELKNLGWEIIVIWECELSTEEKLKKTLNKLIKKITQSSPLKSKNK